MAVERNRQLRHRLIDFRELDNTDSWQNQRQATACTNENKAREFHDRSQKNEDTRIEYLYCRRELSTFCPLKSTRLSLNNCQNRNSLRVPLQVDLFLAIA